MMAFLTSPLGRVILIGAALLAWTVYQREQAADRARGHVKPKPCNAPLLKSPASGTP